MVSTIDELELRIKALESAIFGKSPKIVEDEGMEKEEKPAGRRKR